MKYTCILIIKCDFFPKGSAYMNKPASLKRFVIFFFGFFLGKKKVNYGLPRRYLRYFNFFWEF